MKAVATGSAALSVAAAHDSATAQVTPAPLAPIETPAPLASAKLPSLPSAVLAESYKVRFDPALTDAERDTIAFAIDANRKAAATLNPKRRRLANGVEPIVRFSVPGGDA